MACSSSQSPDDLIRVEVPPGRGSGTGGSPDDAHDALDSGSPADRAGETADAMGEADGDAFGDADGDVADAPEADRPDVADGPVDAPRDLPVDRPPAANGQACGQNSECKSKFCVDGVCCENTCDSADPDRCRACSNAKTGQKDGTCAADRTREKMKCGEACSSITVNVPAVFEMVCQAGVCAVPANPTMVGDPCRKEGDMCTVSFCDQPTTRTARCVQTLCPTKDTCCCEQPGNVAQRSCVAANSCHDDRMCVTQ